MKRGVLYASETYHSTSTDGYQLRIADLVVKSNTTKQEYYMEGYYDATYHHQSIRPYT
jgi:hypothetical protein